MQNALFHPIYTFWREQIWRESDFGGKINFGGNKFGGKINLAGK
jgi:hypothetical protein